MKMYKVKCKVCGKEFEAESLSRRYCSRECRAIGGGKPISGVSRWGHSYTQICQNCGREFVSGSANGKFCSSYCRDKYKRMHPPEKKKSTINDIVKEATEAGMSYGEYVARRGL